MPVSSQQSRSVADRLRDAAAAYEQACERVAAVGEDDIERVREAHRRATDVLATYGDRALGTGNFEAYVKLEAKFATVVEGLPEDLPRRGAFEDALETLDRRRLREQDLDGARDHLDRAAEIADRLDERETARETYQARRTAANDRLDDIATRLDDLDRIERLGAADLDAPVEQLRDPIERYNDAVREAFDEYYRTASARDVLAVLATAEQYPLVGYRPPPDELQEYVETHAAGSEPIPTLLEYAEYSPSKLAHHVEDGGALKRTIATRRTYLDGLDAGPLTVAWPPPSAERLWWETRSYRAIVGRFADSATVGALRAVRRLATRDDYAALRDSAVARAELTDDQRRRIQSGALEEERAELEAERERLREALDDDPTA
jgi:hypothetical protein